jgi:glycosyltransferase involved in cell wall biosynthesis
VLFLHPSDELYGSDLSLLNMARGLDRARFTPVVVLANDLAYEGALSSELAAAGIECRHLPIAPARRKYLTPTGLVSFRSDLRRAAELIAGIVRDEHFDVVHTNTLAVWSGGMAAKRAGRPHVWHVQEQVERPAFLRRFLQRFVPAHASRVVGVSQAALDNILVGPAARAKGEVIYNAVDPGPWAAATGRERLRTELGCGPEDVLVGMVARVSRLKGADLWAEGGTELLARHPNLHCFLAGGPVPGQNEVLDDVQARVAGSAAPERFHVLGLRRDVPDLMAAMDVLVAPSREGEGSSLTIIQGMFAGKPVVATDVGGNRELLRDGETGLLIAKEDVRALSAAVARLVEDANLRQRMGQAGRARAAAHFTVEEQVRRISDVLWAEYEASHASQRSAR